MYETNELNMHQLPTDTTLKKSVDGKRGHHTKFISLPRIGVYAKEKTQSQRTENVT